MPSISIPNLEALPEAAEQFARALKQTGSSVVAFYGEMGVGKTTFIARLVKTLGVDPDFANSPSFSIVNEYDSPDGTIYHFDLYRLDSPAEALDLGLDEYLYSGKLCLLEWPERIEPLIPDEALRVDLTLNPDGSRSLSWQPPLHK